MVDRTFTHLLISKFKTAGGGGGLYPEGQFYGGFFALRIWRLIFGGDNGGILRYFSENFRCKLTYCESENFSGSSLYHIFESENFRFPIL